MKDDLYLYLVDRMSESTFSLCVHKLFPRCGFHLLSEGDMRKIDLKEKLYSIFSPHFTGTRFSSDTLFDRYISTIGQYLQDPLPKNSDALSVHLHNRGVELISSMQKAEYALEDLESLFVIYLCLSRSKLHSDRTTQLIVKPDDFAVLENTSSLHPIPLAPKKAGAVLVKTLTKPTLPDRVMLFMNTLLLCDILQMQGDLGEKEI